MRVPETRNFFSVDSLLTLKMAKKFDTNPLDPDFPEKVKELETQTLETPRNETRRFAEPLDTEEQTRKLDTEQMNGFSNPVSPQTQQLQPVGSFDDSITRKHSIGSITLPENILIALSYVPFAWIGLIAGIIQLIFIPRTEPRVRYHAAQGVAAHIGIFLVLEILDIASFGSDLADAASAIFAIVTSIILCVFTFKAWQGKPIHIETVESLTDWLEERISPKE